MRYEACELIATHLRESEYGVNLLRTSVPLAPMDPPIETDLVVKSEYEIEYLADGELPASAFEGKPGFLVRGETAPGEFAPAGSPEIPEGDSHLGVAVFVYFPRRAQRALHLENRMMSALLRVGRRSLGHLFESRSITERELRGVCLVSLIGAIRVVPTIVRVGEIDVIAGALMMDLNVTDRWAEGITTT